MNRIKKAASGFEPENGGFADLCLPTWLSRRKLFKEKIMAFPIRIYLLYADLIQESVREHKGVLRSIFAYKSLTFFSLY
jgi:hypothetical protein